MSPSPGPSARIAVLKCEAVGGNALAKDTLIRSSASLSTSEAFEERAAIMVYEGGIPTDRAMDLGAQAQGFRNQATNWAGLGG